MSRLTKQQIEEMRDGALAAQGHDPEYIALCSLALEAIEGGWIKSSDRLPPETGKVWGWNGDAKVQGDYWFNAESGTFESMSSEAPRNITHWILLPAPPELREKLHAIAVNENDTG